MGTHTFLGSGKRSIFFFFLKKMNTFEKRRNRPSLSAWVPGCFLLEVAFLDPAPDRTSNQGSLL